MSPRVEDPPPAASGAAQTRPASAVALYVRAAVDIEVTITETLRLSRLVHSPADGYWLEHHGDLIPPGTTHLRLDVGVYHFKSNYDVHLRIYQPDAVEIVTPLPRPEAGVTADAGARA